MANTQDSIKRCSKCGVGKPHDEFRRHRSSRSGLQAYCRPCAAAYETAWHSANREKVAVRQAAYRSANKDKIAAYRDATKEAQRVRYASWRMANKESIKANKAAEYAANKVKVKARTFAWYYENKARAAKAHAAWNAANTDKLRVARAARYAAQKEVYSAKFAAWRKANPGMARAHSHARRARKRSAAGTFNVNDVADVRKMQRDKCGVCRLLLKGKGQIDHIVPLARGGTNDRRNIQLLCQLCNNRKWAHDPIEFMQSLGILL